MLVKIAIPIFKTAQMTWLELTQAMHLTAVVVATRNSYQTERGTEKGEQMRHVSRREEHHTNSPYGAGFHSYQLLYFGPRRIGRVCLCVCMCAVNVFL